MIPVISILVPVYNASRWLRECLDSIVGQTYTNLQVVLLDDGSTDNSLAICREYADKYPFVEVYHQENQGVAAARNALLDRVKGEYVLFVDADDWIERDAVEYLVSVMLRTNADMVTCVKYNQGATIIVTEDVWLQERAICEFLRHVCFSGALWNKLLRADLLRGLRFDERITYGEDALLIWGVLQRIGKVVITDKELYHYRSNDASISHQQWHPQKKGSGHLVWESICCDVQKNWPQYAMIANARFALEDMWALYFASLAAYPYDEHIVVRQRNVRQNLKNIRLARLDGLDKYMTAWLLCRWYGAGRVFGWLKSVKR